MQNSKIIYSLRIFLKLKELGYNPIATFENPNYPGFTCWVFERTPAFTKDLDSLIHEGGAAIG